MWNTESLWVEIAAVCFLYSIGYIFLGHFEERTSKYRKLAKLIVSLVVVIALSVLFGRAVAFSVLGLLLLPVFYIHAIWLPNKGINGWTGEPKSKYYELRGWRKDIFDAK